MSQFLRLWIVVFYASIGSLAVRTATAQPQDTPAPAAPREIIAPAESVPVISPPAEPEPGPTAPQLLEIPAAVVPTPAYFSVESEAVVAICEKIEQALNATADVDFNETPLRDVTNYLRETYQIPIIIDKRALDDVGMGSDSPVTLSIRGISLRSVLNLMVKELKLTYVVHDQVLKITTPEGAENELAARVYPVADLAVACRQSFVVDEQESNYAMILRVITGHVAPDSWDDVGGRASAWSFDPWGILVVSQKREDHEALESLLAAVRKGRRSAEGATETSVDTQPIPVTSDVKLAAHAKIEQVLSTVVNVDFAETSLNEVAKYLGDAHGIPIWIDRRALDDVGMGGDTPVTFSLQSVSLRSALRLMLRELDLVYQVDDEVLKITTAKESENALTMRVYPVGDFLESPPNAAGRLERSQGLDRLLDLIESTVAPNTWEHVGGSGVLSPVEPWGLLVISQTEEVHEQVNRLLQTARRSRHAAPAPAASSAPSLTTPTAFLKVYTVPDFDTEQLMTAIRGVVAPETWGNGANMAAIFSLGTRILIRQTPAAHAEIQELIDGLRLHKEGNGGIGGPNRWSSSGGFF
jgi:hypothetical protein